MKAIPHLLIVLFLTGCEPQENLADDGLEFIDEAPRILADLNLPEPELDDLTLKITEGYEHLRPFLQQDIPPEIFEVLLGDIHRDLDKKRIAAESKPGHWLFGATIDQRGVGLLSVFKERDPPAEVWYDYHSWKSTQLEIRKPPVWDRINLVGAEYGRMFQSEIMLTATKDGIIDLTISFMIIITQQPKQEIAELEYKSGNYVYQLRGSFSTYPGLPEDNNGSDSWLAHYNPDEKVERSHAVNYLGSKILSRQVFCEGGFDLSQQAKKHLLEIMDIVMVNCANITGKSVFRELLEKQPYQLVKER